MKLPQAVIDTLERYVQKFAVPQGAPGEAIEEAVRQWTNNAVEQVVYEHPNEGWGSKRADAGRPQSKDGMANNTIQAGKLLVWDLVTGAGTGNGSYIGSTSDSADISGQVYLPKTGVNHVGVTEEPVNGGGEEPTGTAFASFDQDVRASLGRVEAAQAALQAQLKQVANLTFTGTFTVQAVGKTVKFTLKKT